MINSVVFPVTPLQKACIGLVSSFTPSQIQLSPAYTQAVAQSGAIPVIIPPCEAHKMDEVLQRVDGIVFTGGGDFTPEMIGERPVPSLSSINTRRDEFEFALFKRVMAFHIPILGICRGFQLMNLVMGGTIYQDLSSEFPTPVLLHSQSDARNVATHEVKIEPQTLLHQLFQSEQAKVNSFHHQALKQLAPGLHTSAVSTDGVIEAVESSEFYPLLGVQWHPECLVGGPDSDQMLNLFQWLTSEALLYRKARSLQSQHTLSIDTHCDTPMTFSEAPYDLYHGSKVAKIDLKKMEDGGLDAVVMAAYIPQLSRDAESSLKAQTLALDLLSQVDEVVKPYSNRIQIVRTPQAFMEAKLSGKKALFKAVENGYAVGKDLHQVDILADQGIVYLTLCHNGHNDLCDSASDESHPEHHGLSEFGKKVVAALNRRGIMVDLSHASEASFYDAWSVSASPIIASHSSVRALCPSPRNLTDDQIRALAKRGGMMNICLYQPFLRADGPATLQDALTHIRYVCHLVGVDYVGIGSDFDGGGELIGCRHSGDYFNFYTALMREGYSSEEIYKITGGNFLRVMQMTQQKACR